MKRNIFRTCVLGLGLLSLASCDDPMDELTSLIYDRVFSPIDFEARSITENSVKLQWVKSEGADTYTIDPNSLYCQQPCLRHKILGTHHGHRC